MLVWPRPVANRKTAFALILMSLAALSIVAIKFVAASGDFWTQKASMHVAREGLGVAVVYGKIYAIGGSTESGYNVNVGGIVATNEEYDPTTDTWTLKAPMPTPRFCFAICAFQDKIYCIGGVTAYDSKTGFALTTANEVYDPATNTWQTRKSSPTPRAWLSANVAGDKMYFVGGEPDRTLNEVYDPKTDSWTTKTPKPTGVTEYVSAVFESEIYFSDGYSPKMEIYNSETDSWSLGAPLPSTVYAGAAAATTGAFAPIRIYFLGLVGFTSQGSMPNRVYDPKTGSWTLGAEVPTNRMSFGIGVVNDTLYVIGGCSYTFPYPADTPYIITESAANEAYTPVGYGMPDPDYTPPTPSPSPSPSPSPTQSPEPQQLDQFSATWVAAVAVPAAVVSIILLVYFKKHRRQTEK